MKGIGVAGIKLGGEPGHRLGLGETALGDQNDRQIGLIGWVLGLVIDGPADQFDGGVRVAGLIDDQPQQMQRVWADPAPP